MKFLTLLVFFFYSAALYSTDLLTRHPFELPLDSSGMSKESALKEGSTGNHAEAAEIFENAIQQLYGSADLERYGLHPDVFRLAMIGYRSLEQRGKLGMKNLLSIIDFTKPSTEKRFYTIDLNAGKLIYHTYVSHGKNTGGNYATSFSNKVHSNSSSLGFFVTGETYTGSKGYSLRLDGMESGYNDKVRERGVVIHEADYVSEKWISKYGRLGRSQGCPALPKEFSRTIIDSIRDRTAIFAYYNDPAYLEASGFLKLENVLNTTIASPEGI